MSHDTLERLPATDADETTAGNYFVANYPPFSFWSAEQIPDALSVLEQPAPDNVPLGVYFHIPFCRKRCHFCYFRVYTDKNATEIQAYLEAGLRELRLYRDRPFLNGRRPHFVYFGGGTPSYLSPKQLQFLAGGIQNLFPWDQAQEVTFECEPGTLNEDKLRAIRDLGVTRLSLGIENFDDHILEINGRAHRSKEVYRAYDFARSIGFPQINVDLIAGMLEETPANWTRCIEETLRLAPDSVTIYQMEIPFNTTIYRDMKESGRLVAPVADWTTKRGWVNQAFLAFEDAGYTVTSAYTAVRDPERTRFIYRDALWTGSDLIGAGVASFSHMGGVHFQNLTRYEEYLGALDRGELPLHRALATTLEERFVREFILQMKLGRVDLPYFVSKFGLDPSARFAEPFGALRERGLLQAEGDGRITLTRSALLRVDALLSAFFLPQHRDARYTYNLV